MYTYNVYGDSMQTTIRVEEDVVKLLEEVKTKGKMNSYNDVIKKLLEKNELSMFGADKKLSKWNESNERARFR